MVVYMFMLLETFLFRWLCKYLEFRRGHFCHFHELWQLPHLMFTLFCCINSCTEYTIWIAWMHRSSSSRAVVPWVWSLDQQNWHYLGNCQKCTFAIPAPSETCKWRWDPAGCVLTALEGNLMHQNFEKHCLQWKKTRFSSFRIKLGFHIRCRTRACSCVLSLQLCLTLCDPVDCSHQASSVHGILQARTLEWVAMPSSRGSSPPRDWTHVSCPAGALVMPSFPPQHTHTHTFFSRYQ